MKILHLIQRPQLRGAEIFASQLSTHLNKLGHEAVIVCLFPGKAELPFKGKIYQLNGRTKKRLYDIKAWKQLARIIQEEQPDLIQANAGDTLKYAVLSKMIFRWKQPVVFRNASTISLYIKSKPSRVYHNIFFRHAHKIISVSKTSAADFAQLYPNYKERIVTIPIGIEQYQFNGNGRLYKNDRSSEGPVIVHVGGFTFEKNHRGLVSIFQRVLKTIPKATLHLVGSGILQPQIEAMVKERGLMEKVVFHGYQSNAMDFIAKADVLVLPSIIEGLPGVILEAFYCKTPVVAYNVGGVGEVVIPNETGRLVEKGNEEQFADAVVAAIEEKEKSEQLVKNAYQLVTTEYMNTRIAERFVQTYASIVSS